MLCVVGRVHHCTIYGVECEDCSGKGAVYNVKCILCIVLWVGYSVQYLVYFVRCVVLSVFGALCSVQKTKCCFQRTF